MRHQRAMSASVGKKLVKDQLSGGMAAKLTAPRIPSGADGMSISQ